MFNETLVWVKLAMWIEMEEEQELRRWRFWGPVYDAPNSLCKNPFFLSSCWAAEKRAWSTPQPQIRERRTQQTSACFSISICFSTLGSQRWQRQESCFLKSSSLSLSCCLKQLFVYQFSLLRELLIGKICCFIWCSCSCREMLILKSSVAFLRFPAIFTFLFILHSLAVKNKVNKDVKQYWLVTENISICSYSPCPYWNLSLVVDMSSVNNFKDPTNTPSLLCGCGHISHPR